MKTLTKGQKNALKIIGIIGCLLLSFFLFKDASDTGTYIVNGLPLIVALAISISFFNKKAKNRETNSNFSREAELEHLM